MTVQALGDLGSMCFLQGCSMKIATSAADVLQPRYVNFQTLQANATSPIYSEFIEKSHYLSDYKIQSLEERSRKTRIEFTARYNSPRWLNFRLALRLSKPHTCSGSGSGSGDVIGGGTRGGGGSGDATTGHQLNYWHDLLQVGQPEPQNEN